MVLVSMRSWGGPAAAALMLTLAGIFSTMASPR